MIVVLDTNVVISAFLSARGAPAQVFSKWLKGEFDVAISPALLDELARALSYEPVRKYTKQTDKEIAQIIKTYQANAILVDPPVALDVIEKDPADNRLLECALAAGAKFIISGNVHLLEVIEFEGVRLLPPAGFLALLEAGGF